MIENIVIQNGHNKQTDIELVFGDINGVVDGEVLVTKETDIPRLLVTLGVYKSTSQARDAGRVGQVPTGYTEYKASKKHRLFIWNPTE